MRRTKNDEIGEEHLFTAYDLEAGPKIPEWQVEFCKQEIEHRCKSPDQRAAAEKALADRNFDAYQVAVRPRS